MKKNGAEQITSKIKELPQTVREYWLRIMVVLGLVGTAAVVPILSNTGGDAHSELVNGHRVSQPEPRPADQAFEHRVELTPPSPGSVAGNLAGYEADDLLPSPVPLPEPPPVPADETPTP